MKYLLEGHTTDRLLFRILGDDDFELWMDLFRNQEAVKMLGLDSVKTPRAQCEQWFKRVRYRYDNDLGGMNGLVDKETNVLVGQCGLLVQEVDGLNELEIGYSILPEYWNKGYATEAARKCRDVAFECNYSDSLISITHIGNLRSQRVAIKNSMRNLKSTTYMGMSVYIFGISKKSWLNMTHK